MLRVGHPDNPLTQCKKLIPSLYMLSVHGGVAAVKRRIPALSAVELQFQLFKEVPATAAPLRNYVAASRKLGIEFTAHAPFLFDTNKKGKPYKALHADWVWVVVPNAYRSQPNAVGEHLMKARVGPEAHYVRLIRVLGDLGIRILTIHVTEHGVIPTEKEWRRYLSILRRLNTLGERCGVTVAMETGGVLERHMRQAVDAGLHLNFDVPHFFMEMLHQGHGVKKANALCIAAFKRFQPHVVILHLSQPTIERDAHMPLLDKRGQLTCIDAILRQMRKKGMPGFAILETMPDKKAITHVHKILNC